MVRVVRAISVDREGIIWLVDSLILSYQLGVPYYPERCPKKNTFLVKAPLFERLSNFARFQIVKRKISQAVGRRWQPMYYATAAAKSESNGVCFHIFSLDAPSFRYQFCAARSLTSWGVSTFGLIGSITPTNTRRGGCKFSRTICRTRRLSSSLASCM